MCGLINMDDGSHTTHGNTLAAKHHANYLRKNGSRSQNWRIVLENGDVYQGSLTGTRGRPSEAGGRMHWEQIKRRGVDLRQKGAA